MGKDAVPPKKPKRVPDPPRVRVSGKTKTLSPASTTSTTASTASGSRDKGFVYHTPPTRPPAIKSPSAASSQELETFSLAVKTGIEITIEIRMTTITVYILKAVKAVISSHKNCPEKS